MCKVLLTILMDMESLMAKQVMDIEVHAIGILGDLKALTLFYVPTCQQKGPCKNPLPAPAPSVPYLQKTLRKFHVYLESVMQKRIRDSISRQQKNDSNAPDAVPSKKRKLDTGGACSSKSGTTDVPKETSSSAPTVTGKEEKPTTSSASSSSSSSPTPAVNDHGMLPDPEIQKNYITQDLITLLVATIDSLLRGLLSANQGLTLESEEEEDDGDDGPIIDVGGDTNVNEQDVTVEPESMNDSAVTEELEATQAASTDVLTTEEDGTPKEDTKSKEGSIVNEEKVAEEPASLSDQAIVNDIK